jgi:hypothetical protein
MRTLAVQRNRGWAVASQLLLLHGAALGLLSVLPLPVLAQEAPPPFPTPTPTNRPATLTFDQLRDGVRQGRKELSALEVEYDYDQKDAISHTDPWLMKYHFAMKGDKRRRENWGNDNKHNMLSYGQAYDGKQQEIWNRDSKMAAIRTERESWMDNDFYVAALRLGVSDQERALGLSLTSLLDNRELVWRMRPTLETVDGAECHVLSCGGPWPGLNRWITLWIDPRIGFSMRFQEVHRPNKQTANLDSELAARYYYREFEKVPPGVYLPRKIELAGYTTASAPLSMCNRVSFTETFNVTKLSVGQHVVDDLFRFVFPPGTKVMNRITNRYYQVGNSGEEMEIR